MIESYHICPKCGQEVNSGLMNAVNHADTCTNDAPNESIESHRDKEEMEKRHQEAQERFKPIWAKMTDEEQNELTFRSMCGLHDSNGNVFMGSAAFIRYHDYKDEMIKKYS